MMDLICQEGRKEIFYLTMHSTHFIYGYMLSDMVEDHSENERGNLLQQGIFYMHHPTDRMTHTSLCYTSHGALAGMRSVRLTNIN